MILRFFIVLDSIFLFLQISLFCTLGVTTDIDISSQNKSLPLCRSKKSLSDLLSLFAGSVLDFE